MFIRTLISCLCIPAALAAGAQVAGEYNASIQANTSSGDFAPYMIGSWNGGRIVRKNTLQADLGLHIGSADTTRRLTWKAGAEIITGIASANHYLRYAAAELDFTTAASRPAPLWIHQLWGQLNYRSIYVLAGQKDYHSKLLDERLTSGDLTRSNNARAIPSVEVGLRDFCDVPLTNGWVQIEGTLAYGAFVDDDFTHTQFNYYNYLITGDVLYTYKRCYFRTKPSQPLSIIVGMQTAGQFGGWTDWYSKGKFIRRDSRGHKLGDFFKMLVPTLQNGDGYYEGNSLGSWDFKARYRFSTGHELAFYFQGPWEDGSGIALRNGTDGLWGISWHAPKPGPVSCAALEIIDFRNMSGPFHWAPGDRPGTTITSESTGGDNYYNSDAYTSYANFGMAMGTPFLKAPIYNLDGFPAFAHNRASGFHAAIAGEGLPGFQWRAMVSWQKAWGQGRINIPHPLHCTSWMAEGRWDAGILRKGLSFCAQIAMDHGSLRGNNFGAYLSVTYIGDFSYKTKK